MRLLQVTTVAAALEAFLVPFARHFRAKGWDVHCAAADATHSDICSAEFGASYDVPWARNPFSLSNLSAASQIRTIVESGGYDLVHVHTPVASFITRWALRHQRQGAKVVYTAHGFHFFETGNSPAGRVYRAAEQLAGPWTDHLVVMNSEDERSALKYGIVPPERLSHVPGIGMDIEDFLRRAAAAEHREQYMDEMGIPHDDWVILMVAEFTENKRHVDVVDAVAALQQAGKSVHLVLAGVGPTSEAVESRASQKGIANRVHFLGFRRDVPGLMRMADMLVLPSDREGLPRSIMEAMALGLPTVGTKIRGIEDLLGGGAGILIRPRDVDGLVDATGRLMDSPGLVQDMIAVAKRRIEDFSLGRVLSAYEEVYAATLGRPLTHPAG